LNRSLLWITTAALGAAATLVTGIGGLFAGIVFLVLALPLVVRGDTAVALSGLLMGFGALWLLAMARQFASGSTLDNAQFWAEVGVVPLVIGCAFLAVAVAAALRRRNAPARI
jgi:hypothetical protein